MGERNRKWSEGAILHVMNRGNEKREIFKEGCDYEYFRSLLKDASASSGYKVLALTAMPNHFHILVKTSDVPIGDWMKPIQANYAKYFNNQYERCGHLFGGRYRSRLIDSQSYLLEASRYIHLNPVRAGIVQKPEDYRYSSYRTYLGLSSDPLIHSEEILKYMEGPAPVELYKEYVESGIEGEALHDSVEGEVALE